MQNAQVLYTFFLFAPNLASCLVYFFVFLHSFSSFSACFSFERCILYKLCSFSNKFSNFGNIFVVFLSLHFIFVRYRIQWNHQFEWFRMYTMCIERLVARTKQKKQCGIFTSNDISKKTKKKTEFIEIKSLRKEESCIQYLFNCFFLRCLRLVHCTSNLFLSSFYFFRFIHNNVRSTRILLD